MSYPTTFSGLVTWANECNTEIITAWSVITSPDQDKRYRALMTANKPVKMFECEGEYFEGNRELLFIEFIMAEPTGADFFVWCQKNLKRYAPAK